MKIRGIVTGIDDLYGSNFEFVFKSDAGLWVQEAHARPVRHDLERDLRRRHPPRRRPTRPAVIGSDITITGRVETKFGLVQLVPPASATTQPDGAGGRPHRASRRSTRPATRCPTAVTLDRDAVRGPGLDRAYYRSLQGMRVRLPEGIATGGGTTKFRDLFLEPGTTAQRLFRKNEPAAKTTPWSDAPAELGVSPDGGAGNPADPRLPWR